MPAYTTTNPDDLRALVLAQPGATRRALMLKRVARWAGDAEARAVLDHLRESCGVRPATAVADELRRLKAAEEKAASDWHAKNQKGARRCKA